MNLMVPLEAGESPAHIDQEKRIVRIVGSSSAGAGKSLHIRRKKESIQEWRKLPRMTTIRQLHSTPDAQLALEKLLPDESVCYQDPHLIHIDVTSAVKTGIEEFIFNLLVLGSLTATDFRIWKRHFNHYYMVEITDSSLGARKVFEIPLLRLLPFTVALQPHEIEDGHDFTHAIKMDRKSFLSPPFQRPYQYLKLVEVGQPIDYFEYFEPKGDEANCISTLLRNYPVSNPSWAQLHCFAKFLNNQLEKCENSDFCKRAGIKGLKSFAVKLMVKMSLDFAVSSHDEVPDNIHGVKQERVQNLQNRQRKWNEYSHPYIFFNDDGQSMTFINVAVNEEGDLLDDDGKILQKSIARPMLWNELQIQDPSLSKKFNDKKRTDQLKTLRLVMGIESDKDPDPRYELTTDNVQKLLATYVQLQCGIPVILRGETGCGKTRMAMFMSELLKEKTGERDHEFVVKKIYGGITVHDIQQCVTKALESCKTDGKKVYLFFDEVNTTEAVHAVKEVMCDSSCDGLRFPCEDLQVIAACNPHKPLSKTALEKLYKSGLGRKIHASERDQLSGEKMHQLLYRVVELPPSMKTFVRDFGEIDAATERLYIAQMAKKLHNDVPAINIETFTEVVCAAQQYVRAKSDECRFVSLRDVERSMMVCEWFNKHKAAILALSDNSRYKKVADEGLWEIVQTIGVCYYVSLEDREGLLERISKVPKIAHSSWKKEDVSRAISSCQSTFLNQADLETTISRNQSLVENFYMMAVCADLQIPLFVIGKPGTSKSLAKTKISEIMRGRSSASALFKKLKEVRLKSFQCSAMSTAGGIKHVFAQCVELQAKNTDTSAIAVLEEIGLAEDSAEMPLKVLHPLLECGSTDESNQKQGSANNFPGQDRPHVGFFGLSNWPLDPAKLNRGLFLLRSKPGNEDLLETAMNISKCDKTNDWARNVLEALTSAYIKIYESQEAEFFGLRDFYSLIKAIDSDTQDMAAIWTAVRRNFDGSEDVNDVFLVFEEALRERFNIPAMPVAPLKQIIATNLREKQTRFLLLLTNSAPTKSLISMVLRDLPDVRDNTQVIFGSSFPGDQCFAEVCRNIHQIKCCMETGKTVILLNLQDVHESLYDALNQHYVTLGDKLFVDIGLGSHRVKCCISPNFRLIVLERKENVYRYYPIPLINRLEKHFINAKQLLHGSDKLDKIDVLKHWTKSFVSDSFKESDTFVGYHEDTIYSAVLFSSGQLETIKKEIMQSMTMDAVYRLAKQSVSPELVNDYLRSHVHHNLLHLLKTLLEESLPKMVRSVEVISFSSVLSLTDREMLEKELPETIVTRINLKEFRFQKRLDKEMDRFLRRCSLPQHSGGLRPQYSGAVLIIECPQAEKNGELIECAKHMWSNKDMPDERIPIILVVLRSIERSSSEGFVLQQSPEYDIYYVDEVKPVESDSIPGHQLMETSLSDWIDASNKHMHYVKHLLATCLVKALVKIEGSGNAKDRFTSRLEILLPLCEKDDSLGVEFRKILLDRMRDALSKKVTANWVASEANNKESLQEGGTFYRTLLLRLTTTLSNIFAHFISVVDPYSNLNFLLSGSSSEIRIKFWLDMLREFPIFWPGNLTEQDFAAVTPNYTTPSMVCKLPFSFWITKTLELQWEKREILQNRESSLKRFLSAFRNTPIYSILHELKEKTVKKFMTRYISDLVRSHYISKDRKNREEHNVIIRIVEMLSAKHWEEHTNIVQSHVDWIPVAFWVFSSIVGEFGKLAEIFKACPALLIDVEKWLSPENIAVESIMHILALKYAIETLATDMEDITEKEPKRCSDWMENTTYIQQTVERVVKELCDEEQRLSLLKRWVPISLLHFLLLLTVPKDEKKEKYLEILINPSKLLLTAMQYPKARVAIAVCKMLRTLDDGLRLKTRISWEDDKCRSCGHKYKDPIYLKCGHFICRRCSDAILKRPKPTCPYCSNEFERVDVKEIIFTHGQYQKLKTIRSNGTSFFKVFMKNVCFSPVKFCKQNKDSTLSELIQLFLTLLVKVTDKKAQCLDISGMNCDVITKSSVLEVMLDTDSEKTTAQLNLQLGVLKGEDLNDLTRTILYYQERILSREAPPVKWPVDTKNMLAKCRDELRGFKELNPSFAYLLLVAKIRYTVACLCSNLKTVAAISKNELKGLIQNFASLNKIVTERKMGDLREYFTKVGCRLYGMLWYKRLHACGILEQLGHPILETAYGSGGRSLNQEVFRELSLTLPYKQYLPEALSHLSSECTTLDKVQCLVSFGSENPGQVLDQIVDPGPLLELDRKLIDLLNTEKSDTISRGSVHSILLLASLVVSRNCFLMNQLGSLVTSPGATGDIKLETMLRTSDVVTREGLKCIRVLVLACLLLGSIEQPVSVKRILSGASFTEPLETCLIKELHNEIDQFSRIIGKNIDEGTHVIRRALHGILKHAQELKQSEAFKWHTPKELGIWTNQFYDFFLRGILKDVDALTMVERDTNGSLLQSPIYRLVYECPNEVTGSQDTYLWDYMHVCSLEDVRDVISADRYMKRSSVLWHILEAEHLEHVQKLESILKLQGVLTDEYQNKMSFENAEENPALPILASVDARLVEDYITAWNAMFPALAKREESRNVADFFDALSVESPIAFFLPCNSGKGRCATILTKYLIEIQNSILNVSEKCGMFPSKVYEADVAQLSSSHFLQIDRHRDILPLVQTHALHEVVQDAPPGKHYRISYNFDALEKLVQENFLKNKFKISANGLPQIWYSRCGGIESDWKDVCKNHPDQTELTTNTIQAVESASAHSSCIYAAVRALSDGISALAKMKTKKKGSLKKFLANDLKYQPSDLSIIPSSADIQQILALYSRLSWIRSVLFVSRGVDPYKEIFPEGSQESINDETLRGEIREVFRRLNIKTCQQQLNQLILRAPDTNPKKSLAKEVLPSFTFDFIASYIDQRMRETLPEDVCFKHISWLFTEMVKYENSLS